MRYFLLLLLIVLLAAAPFAAADIDNFFSVKENPGEYTAVPGDDIVMTFTLANRDLVYPKNVTAYIDPCPVGWVCEQRTLSFPESGLHAVNLTVEVPETASPKRYTMYIMLESYYDTRRGDDKVLVNLVSDETAAMKTYDEYIAGRDRPVELEPEEVWEGIPEQAEEPEPETQPEPEQETAPENELSVEPAPAPVKEDVPEQGGENDTMLDDVGRLESNRQFVEYASIILIALLAFIAVGAFVSYRRKEGK